MEGFGAAGEKRMLLGDSASYELLGAAEIRTPAFPESARARGRVRAVAAIASPAAWGPTHASTGQGTRAGAQERLHRLTAELTPQLAAEARAQRRRSA
jgi:hypothetical protein